MKILMVDDYGYMAGGAENYLFAIAEALRAEGHEVRLLASDKQGGGQADYTFGHVHEQSPLRFVPYIFNTSARRAMRRAVADFAPDVVHIHSFFYHGSPALLYGLRGTPTVITLHCDDLISTFGHQTTPACKHGEVAYCHHCIGLVRATFEDTKRWFLRRALPRVSLFIGPSQFMADFYQSRGYHKDKVVHLKNGFNLQLGTVPPVAERKGLLLIARLAPEKGVDVAVRAMAEVAKSMPDAHVSILGDGPERQNLEQLAADLHVQPQVRFLGRIDNAEITKHLRTSQALLVPSVWNENLPTVCIEAMVAGTPIIGSEVGGIPEMVRPGKNGLLFARGDHQALAGQIVSLLQDADIQQRFSDTAVQMAKEYHMETHIPKLVALYQRAVEGAR